ncbi:hypothetical protein BH24DEI2_BH24DEI2_02040 [soil metagenome]
MKKQVVNLLAFVLLSSFAVAQTSEEVRQEKLEYRHTQAPLAISLPTAQATSFEEEMRQARLEHHAFRVAQRHAHEVSSETVANKTVANEKVMAASVSEAEEMRQVKQDYRAFSSAHKRQLRNMTDVWP